jgi:hypothetical protein
LTLVLNHLLDHGDNDTSNITAAIEAVIDEIKDLEEIKHLFDVALMDMQASLKTNPDELIADTK